MKNANGTKKSIFKRWWFWVIIVVVAVGIGAGGSSRSKKEDSGKTAVASSSDAAGKTKEESKEDTKGEDSSEADEQEESKDGAGEKDTDTASDTAEVSISEQVLADQDGIKVTATGLEDSFYGPTVKLKIENNSDKAVMVQSRDVAVNGIMFSSSSFSSDVAAGKTANTELSFFQSELKNAGVDIIGTIEMKVAVMDGDTWDEVFTTEQTTIPTSADGTFEQTYDDSGYVAIDQDGYRVIVKKLDSEDSFWGADIYVYVENNSDRDITIQTRDVSINGVMTEPMFSCEVLAGKKAFDTITFLQSDLDDNSITDITDMELYFTIFDSNSWETIVDTDIVSVHFE